MRKLLAITAVGVALLGTASCTGKITEPGKDAKVSDENNAPAVVGRMPDGFNNWASKCDGPNRVYTTFHADSAYGGVAVVANDLRCTHANP